MGSYESVGLAHAIQFVLIALELRRNLIRGT